MPSGAWESLHGGSASGSQTSLSVDPLRSEFADAGRMVITAPVEIDLTIADQLRAVLLNTAAQGHVTVVVDLTRTRLCDSYGLHTLLRAHQLAVADGGGLRLVTPADGSVRPIFTLTCLDTLIPCCVTLKEALAQARGPDADRHQTATAKHDRGGNPR